MEDNRRRAGAVGVMKRAVVGPRQKVKVGVIGVGNLGQHHARIYAQSKQAELVGVADINSRAAQTVAGLYKAKPFANYLEMLGEVEAVSIAVPTVKHYEVAKAALEAGIHVLIEKPITPTLLEAEELLSIASRKGRLIQVGHIERFNVALQALQKVVTAPKLIEADRVGPFTPRTADVGVVLDLMIHDIDIILNVVQSPLEKIDAIGMSLLSPFEDVASARLQFANRCVANLTASRVTRQKRRSMTVFQKDLYVVVDYVGQDVTIYRKDLTQGRTDDPQSHIIVDEMPLVPDEPLRLQLEHFLECVQIGEEPKVSGHHGKQALEVALEILKKIHK